MNAAEQELLDYMAARRCQKPEQNGLDLARLTNLSIIAALPVAALLAVVCLFDGTARPQGYTVDPGDMAGVMAEKFVTQHLHCPTTAKYPYAHSVERDGETWRVSSYVDAENKFGATVRQHWSVSMTNSGDQWQLLNLEWSNQ